MTQPSQAMSLSSFPTATKLTIVGLLAAAVGIVLQYLAYPEDFPTVPPGAARPDHRDGGRSIRDPRGPLVVELPRRCRSLADDPHRRHIQRNRRQLDRILRAGDRSRRDVDRVRNRHRGGHNGGRFPMSPGALNKQARLSTVPGTEPQQPWLSLG